MSGTATFAVKTDHSITYDFYGYYYYGDSAHIAFTVALYKSFMSYRLVIFKIKPFDMSTNKILYFFSAFGKRIGCEIFGYGTN